jgi:quercetin dioxygenase-like cupin family protein
MTTDDNAAAETRRTESGKPFSVPPGEGYATWPINTFDTIKVTADQTGGQFALNEIAAAKGAGPPLHVHEREDEGYYILEGEYSFFVGQERIAAPSGTWVFCPRRIPHTFRAETTPARALVFIVPGGFEAFFVEAFGRAPKRRLPPPPQEPPDLERLSRLTAKHGVTILGPHRPRSAEGRTSAHRLRRCRAVLLHTGTLASAPDRVASACPPPGAPPPGQQEATGPGPV